MVVESTNKLRHIFVICRANNVYGHVWHLETQLIKHSCIDHIGSTPEFQIMFSEYRVYGSSQFHKQTYIQTQHNNTKCKCTHKQTEYVFNIPIAKAVVSY